MTTPEADRPLEPGTIVARNYRVTARLGAGGMGTVYLADNLTLNQRVVVKVLRGGQAGAGQEEAQVLANLQHPNVVTVYAHDLALDCIVMEFLDGVSLSSLLEKGVDRVNAIRIALAVAEALAAVHKRGLVHRDIKPENVMLALNQGGGGRFVDWLKLIDFGTALKAGKEPVVLLGTPEFCPPEQFHPEAAHPANDVYALGVTIFTMMTGVFPFDGAREDLPRKHHEVTPPGLSETLISRFGRAAFDPRTLALLEDLGELLAQMLAKPLQDRPTAQEVARRLTRLESSFAEAGTYVGGPGMSHALTEPTKAVARKKTATSVLTPAFTSASKTGPTDKNSSQTTPDVERVTTAPSVPALKPDHGFGSSEPTITSSRSIQRVRSPAAVRAASPSPPPALPPAPATGSEPALEAASQPALEPVERSNRGLIIGLVVVVVVLAVAVLALDGSADAKPTAKPDPVPPTPVVAVPPKVVTPQVPPPAVVDAGADEAAVDAGVVAAPVDAGTATAPEPGLKPRPVQGKPPKGAACEFDEAFERGARQTMAGLRKGATPAQADMLEDLSDELHAAFKARDCRLTNVVLRKMRGVVRGGAK